MVRDYDPHLINKGLEKQYKTINCIPNNTDKYI